LSFPAQRGIQYYQILPRFRGSLAQTVIKERSFKSAAGIGSYSIVIYPQVAPGWAIPGMTEKGVIQRSPFRVRAGGAGGWRDDP